jgi:hypothetical protein
MKQWWVNLLLLLLAIGLGVVAIVQPKMEKEAKKPQKLINIKADDVTHLRIEYHGRSSIDIEKNAVGDWYLKEPLQMAANPIKINSILKFLDNTSYARFSTQGSTLEDFGLAPARLTLIINDSAFLFGSNTPLDGQRYVRINQNIHVTSDNTYYKLIVEPASLVHLNVLGLDADIAAIDTPFYQILKSDGAWVASTPDVAQGDYAAAAQAWQDAQAFNVREYESGEAAHGNITIYLEDEGSPRRFEVRSLTPDFTLADANNGVMYDLPASRLIPLMQLPYAQPSTSTTTLEME